MFSPLVVLLGYLVTVVEVTLEKVIHGKLKFAMVNGTANCDPQFSVYHGKPNSGKLP